MPIMKDGIHDGMNDCAFCLRLLTTDNKIYSMVRSRAGYAAKDYGSEANI